MSKNVLVLMGSPRKKGNTSILCDEFIRGAVEAGHQVEKIDIIGKKIAGCLGCNGCKRNGGTCVQKDDMQEIYGKILAADVIVLASPIYYYTWTAQLKAVIDRTYALLGIMKNKVFYMLSTCMSPDEAYCQVMIDSFRTYLDCYDETVTEGGYLFGFGTGAPGDVTKTDAMEKAFEMGKEI
jgi:multimeric flavodoxin WrbA